ncbi:MAG: DNA repair protein RecO [Bacteroidales bacterium]|nr:DNA repair protein RecO [Bacteroidales bacterium]
MIEKTKGIVVKTTKYSETSLIVKIFTEAFGMRTYMIRGVRKKKSRTPLNLFQPLSILDLVVYEKTNRDLQNTKDVKSEYIYTSIPYEIKKSSIIIFLNELIFQSIKEEEANPNLFQFLYHSLIYLDEIKTDYQNFHLYFMIQLTRFLGFEPSHNFSTNQKIFDLQEGRYTSLKLTDAACITPPLSHLFHQLSTSSSFKNEIHISRSQRQLLIDKILMYYQFHLAGFTEMKSIGVLLEVME